MTQADDGKRTCVFCGGSPVTREHVWPDWLARECARRYGDLTFTATRGGLTRTSPVIDAIVKRVCATCNHGWMASLEETAKPILTPMIFGERESIELSPAEQAVVATWALKTALMNDVYFRSAAFSPTVYRRLYETRKPGSDCMVRLAAYGGRRYMFAVYSAAVSLTAQAYYTPDGVLKNEPVPMTGGISTARLVHLILQVLVFDRNDLPIPVFRNPVAFDRMVWPADVNAVHWPPNRQTMSEDLIPVYAEGGFFRKEGKPDDPTVL